MKKGSKILTVLHSQRAILSILILVVVGLLFAVFFSEFYTKGEPREAIVAQAMLKSGNYVLPTVYASEFAYKPPMLHWLIAGISSIFGGEVTPISAKIPSAIAFVIVVLASFAFFNPRVRFRTSYLATLILITSFEMHRTGQEARVDMLLTMFIVLTLFALFRWEEQKKLCGIPFLASLLISGGILTKGPVALVLPMIIFGVFLALFKQYRLIDILRAIFITSILSILIPSVWYFEGWQIGGDKFLMLHFGESISRFFHMNTTDLWYPLGHEKPFFYPILFLLVGLLPWSLLIFFVPWGKKELYQQHPTGEERLSNMRFSQLNGLRKVHLFSLVVVIITLLFFMIPSSKRSVYLLPLYPFISLLFAEIIQQLVKNARKLITAFSFLMAIIGLICTITLLLILLETYKGFIPSSHSQLSFQISELREGMIEYLPLSILLIFGLFISVLATFYQSFRRGYTKLAYCIVLVMFFINLNIDGPLMMGFKKQNSSQRFAKVIQPIIETHPAEVYTISRLKERILNLYGLAFYTNITPKDFEVEQPQKGYLILFENNLEEVQKRFLQDYHVTLVASDTKVIQDGGVQLLLWIEHK